MRGNHVGAAVGRRAEEHEAWLLSRLAKGEKKAWDAFVERYAPVIYGAVLKVLRRAGHGDGEETDVAQDVFLKLCRDDFRLLARYDPSRASLSTWLTVIATTTAIDHLRRRGPRTASVDQVPEAALAVDPATHERLSVPPGLLTERQMMILRLLYDRDMDVAEVAELLDIDPQTVRSTRHKALVKLRRHFRGDE